MCQASRKLWPGVRIASVLLHVTKLHELQGVNGLKGSALHKAQMGRDAVTGTWYKRIMSLSQIKLMRQSTYQKVKF